MGSPSSSLTPQSFGTLEATWCRLSWCKWDVHSPPPAQQGAGRWVPLECKDPGCIWGSNPSLEELSLKGLLSANSQAPASPSHPHPSSLQTGARPAQGSLAPAPWPGAPPVPILRTPEPVAVPWALDVCEEVGEDFRQGWGQSLSSY